MTYSDFIHGALLITVWIVPGLVASGRKHPWSKTIWVCVIVLGCLLNFGIVWIPLMVWACWRFPKPEPPEPLEPLNLDDDK